MTAVRATHLAAETILPLYGKKQRLRYRHKILLARFIDGTKVHAVWCEFYDEKKGLWNKPHLLLSTNIELSAQDVIQPMQNAGVLKVRFTN